MRSKALLSIVIFSSLVACANGLVPKDGVIEGADAGMPTSYGSSDGALPDTSWSLPDSGALGTEIVDGSDAADAITEAATADVVATDGGCGDPPCTIITLRDIGSHFTGLGCTGTESYYTPYNGYDGIRRSWDGTGLAGSTLRTETNRSFKLTSGTCQDLWPGGNTLSDFVRIYR